MKQSIHSRLFNPTTLMVVLGMQFFRLLFPGFVYYLRDTLGWSSLSLAPIALGVFGLTILAAPLAQWLGKGGSTLWVLMVVLRVGEYLSRSPAADLALVILGVITFGMYLALAASSAQAAGEDAGHDFVVSFLFGIAFDTAIHTGGLTLDLSWHADIYAASIIFLLGFALLVNWFKSRWEPEPMGSSQQGGGPGWPLLAIGPFIFFQLLIFQNVGLAVSLTGWPLPAAGMWIWLSTALALLVVLAMERIPLRKDLTAILAGLALVIAMSVLYRAENWGAAGLLLLASVSGTYLWGVTIKRLTQKRPASVRRNSVLVMNTLGLLLFVTFSFLYYVSYDLSLGFRAPILLPVLAGILALLGLFAARSLGGARQGILDWSPLVPMTFFLLPPILLGLNWRPVAFENPPLDNRSLRLMTYNLHQGFNTDGALNIEELARVIEASGADVIALQEVTRSYVTNGSLDMLPWLSQRLGLPYFWGPTDPPQWGNALLSRYPIIDPRNLALPPDDLNLRRGFIDTGIDFGGGSIRIIATHLHHLGADSVIRQVQVVDLLEAWNGTPRTAILGDLNAEPDSPEMQLLAAAGFFDSLSFLQGPATYTFYAANPTQQIDYIWLTSDIQPENVLVPMTLASDHFPVIVDIRLP